MTTMITEVYTAFRKAGVPEEEAKAAAEALSSDSVATKGDIHSLEIEQAKINAKLAVIEKLQWIIVAGIVGLVIKDLVL